MTAYDQGPLIPYLVTWRSGHIETVHAHQVLLPVSEGMNSFAASKPRDRVTFHGEVGGHWGLILDADYDDILSVRRLSSADAEAPTTPTD